MSEAAEVDDLTKCPSCQREIDVTGIGVGDEITCPLCNHEFKLTRQFGNYLLEKQIGSGGMGAVFLGQDLLLHRVVAIKLLKPELVADQKFLQTFLYEAQITASLNHPNIVQVYAFGEQNETYYLVMEHIPGGSLDDKITDFGRITELEVIEIGIAVSSGLDFAQKAGLIHRDIKPGNILFGTNNVPKVVDFGLSLSLDTVDHFAGEIWGTPYYVAPEKLERLPEDWRSDLYSLGATLFHAIAGRPPYEAEDPTEVAMKHLSGNIVSVKAFAPKVSNQTAFAISRALARYPNDRYKSYEEFISQLEDSKRRIAGAATGEPKPAENIRIIEEETGNRQTLFIIGGLCGVALLLIISLVFFRDRIFGGDKDKPPVIDVPTSRSDRAPGPALPKKPTTPTPPAPLPPPKKS